MFYLQIRQIEDDCLLIQITMLVFEEKEALLSTPEFMLCVKCKAVDATIDIRHTAFCNICFLDQVHHKYRTFITRVGRSLRRISLVQNLSASDDGESRTIKIPAAVALSGGSSSRYVLLETVSFTRLDYWRIMWTMILRIRQPLLVPMTIDISMSSMILLVQFPMLK